jgi:hypothetical protein
MESFEDRLDRALGLTESNQAELGPSLGATKKPAKGAAKGKKDADDDNETDKAAAPRRGAAGNTGK